MNYKVEERGGKTRERVCVCVREGECEIERRKIAMILI